jgi:hypothetical protein
VVFEVGKEKATSFSLVALWLETRSTSGNSFQNQRFADQSNTEIKQGTRLRTGKDGRHSAAQSDHSHTVTIGSTQAGVIPGTAAYMAPEQARVGSASGREAAKWSSAESEDDHRRSQS